MYKRGDVEIVRYCYYTDLGNLTKFIPKQSTEDEFSYRSRFITRCVPWYITKTLVVDTEDQSFTPKITMEIYIFYKNYYSNLARLLLSYDQQFLEKIYTLRLGPSNLEAAVTASLLIKTGSTDYLNSSFYANYDMAIALENDMRENMYFGRDPKYYQKYYGLVQLNEELWQSVRLSRHTAGNDMLFTESGTEARSLRINKRSYWRTIQYRLEMLKPLFSIPGVFVAGGAIFSILTGAEINDIDIFFYGDGDSGTNHGRSGNGDGDLTQRIRDLIEHIKQVYYMMHSESEHISVRYFRTKNALTIKVKSRFTPSQEFQIIFRHYNSPSEVLHGFDVDCSSVGYDGENIWFTQRALFALYNRYNTVNFERLSASYEHRLGKYGTRGMMVKIPEFNSSRVSIPFEPLLKEKAEVARRIKSHEDIQMSEEAMFFRQAMELKKYRNLDKLIFLDALFRNNLTKTVRSEDVSDYNGYDGKVGGASLGEQLGIDNESFKKIDTNYLLGGAKKLNYVRTFVLDYALEIPDQVYQTAGKKAQWTIPQKIEWKVQNPGEQMTNTFQQVILQDNSQWYRGKLYNLPVHQKV